MSLNSIVCACQKEYFLSILLCRNSKHNFHNLSKLLNLYLNCLNFGVRSSSGNVDSQNMLFLAKMDEKQVWIKNLRLRGVYT